jgi:hypothetical protein
MVSSILHWLKSRSLGTSKREHRLPACAGTGRMPVLPAKEAKRISLQNILL